MTYSEKINFTTFSMPYWNSNSHTFFLSLYKLGSFFWIFKICNNYKKTLLIFFSNLLYNNNNSFNWLNLCIKIFKKLLWLPWHLNHLNKETNMRSSILTFCCAADCMYFQGRFKSIGSERTQHGKSMRQNLLKVDACVSEGYHHELLNKKCLSSKVFVHLWIFRVFLLCFSCPTNMFGDVVCWHIVFIYIY